MHSNLYEADAGVLQQDVRRSLYCSYWKACKRKSALDWQHLGLVLQKVCRHSAPALLHLWVATASCISSSRPLQPLACLRRMEENAFEVERRKHIEANQAKLRALGLRCSANSTCVTLCPCPRVAPQQRKRTRPAEQVRKHQSHHRYKSLLAISVTLLVRKGRCYYTCRASSSGCRRRC